MLTRKTPRRKCKAHEREWNGFCVDKNLEDDWLERLNALAALNLISMCEGHDSDRRSSHGRPHIKLRLKDHLLNGIAAQWDEHKIGIINKVNELFRAGDTYVTLELKFKLRTTTSRLNYEESLFLGIHSREPRASEEMDAGTRDWFLQSVNCVEELDKFIIALLE
jgi:hypothetical protein